MTTEHTPGRWSRNIKPATKYNTIFADRNTHICHLTVTGLTAEEVEGNCNLITAAPELLATCRRAIVFLDLFEEISEQAFGNWAEVRRELKTAVAWAEGEPVFYCRGCNREESVCSADPCEGVIADREGL